MKYEIFLKIFGISLGLGLGASSCMNGGAPSPIYVPLAGLAGSSTAHIPTWTYDQYMGQAGDVDSATINRWVDYAESSATNHKAFDDCAGSHCRAVVSGITRIPNAIGLSYQNANHVGSFEILNIDLSSVDFVSVGSSRELENFKKICDKGLGWLADADHQIVLHSKDVTLSPNWLSHRLFHLGWYMLLNTEDDRVISWEDMESNSSSLAIFPEAQWFARQPQQVVRKTVGELEVSAGIFRREFSSCKIGSTDVGACAVILNTTTEPSPIAGSWLSLDYDHLLKIDGGDLMNGGKLEVDSTSYVPGATLVPAQVAVILVGSQSRRPASVVPSPLGGGEDDESGAKNTRPEPESDHF